MRTILTFGITLISMISFGQENKQTAFSIDYAYQIPKGILSETFGNHSAVGISYFFENTRNLFFGLEGRYIFGSNINDTTLFEDIETGTGALISSDGTYANITLMQRGFDSYIFLGYCMHTHNTTLTGFYFSAGLGYLQNKIFIDTRNQNIPQLSEEYKKGYDKLSSGLSTKLSVDYKYYSKKGRVQFLTGINYIVSQIKNQRIYDFNDMDYTNNQKEWVQLIGFKVGIIIPVKRRNEEKFHYF